MIKRQEGYQLKNIEGVYHLLPFGQKVADQKRGITMNETGVFLWNALETPRPDEELICLAAEYYGITESEEKEQLKKDILEFVSQLQNLGILRRNFTEHLSAVGERCCAGMQIAGIEIGFLGVEEMIPEKFHDFMTKFPKKDGGEETGTDGIREEDRADNWDQIIEFTEYPPESRQNGKVLLRNKELTVSEWEEGYILTFPSMSSIYEAYMTEDGSYVRIYCRRPFGDEEVDQLFHAVRMFYLYLAQKKGYYAVHSASILYEGKAWLFSGHSGMGKSTHTAMWHEQLGVPYLNGDLNLIGRKDGKMIVRGIPWCGTSEIYTTEDHELGGIVLLGRDTKDHVEPLSTYEKIMRVMQRMISPVWKEELLEKNLEFSKELAKEIPVLHLFCTKEFSAVKTMKKEIDRLGKENGTAGTIQGGQYKEMEG